MMTGIGFPAIIGLVYLSFFIDIGESTLTGWEDDNVSYPRLEATLFRVLEPLMSYRFSCEDCYDDASCKPSCN